MANPGGWSRTWMTTRGGGGVLWRRVWPGGEARATMREWRGDRSEVSIRGTTVPLATFTPVAYTKRETTVPVPSSSATGVSCLWSDYVCEVLADPSPAGDISRCIIDISNIYYR